MTIALAAMSVVPGLRRVLVHRAMKFSEQDIADVTVKIADTSAEVLEAARLVHDAYVERDLLTPHASGVRVTAHGILPTTHTLVAKIDGRVVGALSLVRDGALGLPLEGIYRDGVQRFRDAGDHLAEVGSLAVAAERRSKGLTQLLYRYVFEVARSRGVDRLVIAVHPKAEAVYCAPLLFERFGDERSYPGLNRSARAIPLGLSLIGGEERMRRTFGAEATTGNPYHVYCAREWPQLQKVPAEELRGSAQRAIAQTLVSAREDVFADLSSTVLAELRRALPGVPLPYGKNVPWRATPSWWSSQFSPT
jgi:GNAT superfamily N-acetyltransferase